MKYLVVLVFAVAIGGFGCSSRKAQAVQTFSPIRVDVEKIQNNDFSDLLGVVNASYDGGVHNFNNAEVIREEGIFLYMKLTGNVADDGCCRVTIDKNRKSILNMQPDCPVSE